MSWENLTKGYLEALTNPTFAKASKKWLRPDVQIECIADGLKVNVGGPVLDFDWEVRFVFWPWGKFLPTTNSNLQFPVKPLLHVLLFGSRIEIANSTFQIENRRFVRLWIKNRRWTGTCSNLPESRHKYFIGWKTFKLKAATCVLLWKPFEQVVFKWFFWLHINLKKNINIFWCRTSYSPPFLLVVSHFPTYFEPALVYSHIPLCKSKKKIVLKMWLMK